MVKRKIEHYNLDMIISVGYRVKSVRGVRFRKWANSVLREYIINGYAVNHNRMKQIGEIIRIMKRTEQELDAKQVLSVIIVVQFLHLLFYGQIGIWKSCSQLFHVSILIYKFSAEERK